MLGDGGTDSRYLGSGEGDGLARMDLGTNTGGFRMSCGGSASWVLSEIRAVLAALCAVLGSRPDTVTVVTTATPLGAGQEGPSRAEGSGWLSPGAPGRPLSEGARDTLSGSAAEVLSGSTSGSTSFAEPRASSEGGALSYLTLGSSFLAGTDSFCLFGAGSASDDT